MKFNLSSPFRFATGQVAVLAVLLYAAVFISVLVTDELPATPKKTEGLDLERAYEALSTVRPDPHEVFWSIRICMLVLKGISMLTIVAMVLQKCVGKCHRKRSAVHIVPSLLPGLPALISAVYASVTGNVPKSLRTDILSHRLQLGPVHTSHMRMTTFAHTLYLACNP